MSGKVLDFEESRIGSVELIDRVVDLQTEITAYERRIETMESLLDGILICLNAYDNGESRQSISSIVKAIVDGIYLCRLQGEESNMPKA
jgi:hypothetical protein